MCLRGWGGWSIYPLIWSLIDWACVRAMSGVYLLADEHPSAVKEKSECRDPSAHAQCGILALVHGTVHQVRWPEGCDTVHHRYLPHPHPLFMSQPGRTFQNTNLLSKHSLNSYPQWFSIAHRKKKNPYRGLRLSGPTYLEHFLYHSNSISALQPNCHCFIFPKIHKAFAQVVHSPWNAQPTLTFKPVRELYAHSHVGSSITSLGEAFLIHQTGPGSYKSLFHFVYSLSWSYH